MAEPVRFVGCNLRLTTPLGREDTVNTMDVFTNGTCVVSKWQLTAEELAAVNASGGEVWLSVLMGRTAPPMFVGSEDAVRAMIADYGVWKKG